MGVLTLEHATYNWPCEKQSWSVQMMDSSFIYRGTPIKK